VQHLKEEPKELVEKVRKIQGVRDVQNLLHLPGAPAPTPTPE
jgi:hypothetical protein